MRKIIGAARSPYRSTVQPGIAKALGSQIAQWKPDLVWCHHGRAASNEDFLLSLHRAGVRTAVYLCDEPYEIGETAKYSPRYKFVFTMDPCTMDVHRMSRADRGNVFYLPPGVDVQLFKLRGYQDRKIAAFFLGNATLEPRLKWLKPIERLVDGADIRFFKQTTKRDPRWVNAEDHPKFYGDCLVGLNVHRHPGITSECFKKRVLGRSTHDPVPKGLKLAAAAPKVEGTGFWNDGDLPAAHVNPRFFEMAACGTLVVSDNHRTELARMFPMAPQAQSPEHFLELVNYYLENQGEAEEIGRACSSLISRRHSYKHRAAEVLIRVGLKDRVPENQLSYLGAQGDWLSPQDYLLLTAKLSSDRTGPSERWSPQFGMSSIYQSGKVSEQTSIDAPTPWL